MTITEYQKQINQINQIKRIKRILTRCAAVVAVLAIVAGLAYSQGTKAGRAVGVLTAFDDITYCTNEGATGYYATETGVRCIYD